MLLLTGAVPIEKLPLLIGEIEVNEQEVKIPHCRLFELT